MSDLSQELARLARDADEDAHELAMLRNQCDSLQRANDLLIEENDRQAKDIERMAGQIKTVHRENGIVIRTMNAMKQMADACSAQIREGRGNVAALRGAPPKPTESEAMPKVARMGPA